MKSRSMRWAGLVACVKKSRGLYRVLVGKFCIDICNSTLQYVVPVAVNYSYCTPDDGYGKYPKHVE
jgi:hypothetical protein